MSQTVTIEDLENGAAFLLTAPSAGVREMGRRLGEWLTGDGGEHLEQALGIMNTGQRCRATVRAFSQRDALIRQTAPLYFPGLRKSLQGELLAEPLGRYHASAWERERNLAECPAKRVGTIYEACWQILKLVDCPLSARRIRGILAAGHELQTDGQEFGADSGREI